jgi:hypothetical protein
MPVKQVLIVGRTKMWGDRVCIGALTQDGENLRLMNKFCASTYPAESPYVVGEFWEIEYTPCGAQIPPHVEDVSVARSKKLGESGNVAADISARAVIWKGGIECLFDGKLGFTQNGSAFISPGDVSTGATGFWMPNTDIELRGTAYTPIDDYRHLKYVGFQEPEKRLQANRLIRVSLARWWKPKDADDDFEERCYGQLSGWF